MAARRIASNSGLSSVEIMVLFAVIGIAIISMAPIIYRHFEGYFFFENARSLDRQFDPYDSSYESAETVSKSFTKRLSDRPMPAANLFASSGESPTRLGGLKMEFSTLSRGPVHREGLSVKETTTVSSGGSKEKYDYTDTLQSVY